MSDTLAHSPHNIYISDIHYLNINNYANDINLFDDIDNSYSSRISYDNNNDYDINNDYDNNNSVEHEINNTNNIDNDINNEDIVRIVNDVNIFYKTNINCYIGTDTFCNIKTDLLEILILVSHTRCKYDLTHKEIKDGEKINKNLSYRIFLTDSFRKLIFHNIKVCNELTLEKYSEYYLDLIKTVNVYLSMADIIDHNEYMFLNKRYTDYEYDCEYNYLDVISSEHNLFNIHPNIDTKFIDLMNYKYLSTTMDNNIERLCNESINNKDRIESINNMKSMIDTDNIDLSSNNENKINYKIKNKNHKNSNIIKPKRNVNSKWINHFKEN